jgi:polygalacturonase
VSKREVENARVLVLEAQKEAGDRNAKRVKNPRLNHYYANNTSGATLRARSDSVDLFSVNSTVAAAAAIVAEADAAANGTFLKPFVIPEKYAKYVGPGISTAGKLKKRATSFWMEDITHQGSFPFGSNNANYQVFRNVRDYGAVGDGLTDDTAAINLAISDGGRCGASCGSSSVKGAVVYFPAGRSPVLTRKSSLILN